MDFLRRRRQNSSQSLQGMSAMDSPVSSTAGSSPASSVYEFKSESFGFIPKALRRSSSRASTIQQPLLDEKGEAPSPRVLQKSRGSFSSFESMKRRSSMLSTTSEKFPRATRRASTFAMTLGAPSATTCIDWKTQQVEAHGALEADPQAIRGKPAYVVVTQDYVVKMRSMADAVATFPQIGNTLAGDCLGTNPEPLLVVPIHTIISVFHAESYRPQFGLEIFWKSEHPKVTFSNVQLFYGLPRERRDVQAKIVQQIKAKNSHRQATPVVPLEVEARILQVFASAEPDYQSCKPEIFPVVRRACARDDGNLKSVDKAKKAQDGCSWYLVVGRNLCYFVEVGRSSGPGIDLRCQAFGLVTLESLLADWTHHEERFVLQFRDPFQPTVTLELASRCYRQIIMTFMKADRFLKPCWPSVWQTMEVFPIPGLTDPQLLVAGDNYGGLKRTLDAYLSAYRCATVEWEINWKTAFAPEFRLLPPKQRAPYSNLQLLAVFKALRYNGYFNSVSFRDIDISGLWNKKDDIFGKMNVPYLNRSCTTLGENDCVPLRFGSVLHQEIHALVYCSETVRQIDFTNCFPEPILRQDVSASQSGLGLLAPVLNMLDSGLTKCNNIILSGNMLRSADIDALLEAMIIQSVEIQALDLSKCGLSDLALRDIFEALFHQGRSIQSLDVSGNCGHVRASVISHLSYTLMDLRKLNVSGVLMGDISGPLFSFETLSRFENLEELDLSKFKINEATLDALERFLSQKPLPQEPQLADADGRNPSSTFRKLGLNTCGIHGREAARLVRALENYPNAHLHLNDNPLEEGIDDLCRAIALTRGPAGLHMNMIEFRDESNYVQLMKALTLSKNISFLSLVGTASTTSADDPCSPETCEALEEFFAKNKSVRYLDFSGYSGKLDEGQLGSGFGRALRGLISNRTLTHLRIRNQNLHDDVGTIGEVISRNSTVRMLDCQNNSWNLTCIQFLAKSLKDNKTMLEFPLSPREYNRIWKRMVSDVWRTSSKAPVQTMQTQQEAILRGALQKHMLEVQSIIGRNRAAMETESSTILDEDDSTETGGETGWPSLVPRAARDGSSVPTTPTPFRVEADPLTTSTPRPSVDFRPQYPTVKSEYVEPNTCSSAPYHVNNNDANLETPPGQLSPNSETPTTPELQSPTTPPDASPRVGAGVAEKDMGPYFSAFSRFKVGGLEAHEEE